MKPKNCAHRVMAIGLLASTCLSLPVAAHAADMPRFVSVDGNGVDLTTGLLWLAFEEGGIGSGDGAVRMQRIWAEDARWTDNWSGRMYETTAGGVTTARVDMNGISDTFTKSGSTYTSTKADGATLVLLGNGRALYTDRDGTTIEFSTTTQNSTCPDVGAGVWCRVPLAITRPNGLKFTLVWNEVTLGGSYVYRRLNSVTSSAGYSATIAFLTNNAGTGIAPPADWFKRSSVTFGNSASPPSPAPTILYSYPSTSVIEVTDPANRVWRFTTDASNRLSGIRRPGSAADSVSYIYTSGTISSATVDGVTTSYSRNADPSGIYMFVTNALNQQSRIDSDPAIGRPTFFYDPLSRVTQYRYDANGRLTHVFQPEGNYTQFTHDARGNVTQAKQVAKPGSGLADIVSSATFDATCSNPVKCNKPNSTTDARLSTTDYAYDPTHGGVTSATLPAPVAGAIRPQIRYSYTPVAGAGGQSVFMLTGVSACQTLASCTGAADEAKTTIGYNSNLLAETITRANGTGTLAAIETRAYDQRGRLDTMDGPLPGTADTTKYRWDNADQLIGIVSPDPDGAGILKHRAIRLTYRPDGQVEKREIGTVNSQSDPDWAAFASAQEVQTAYDGNSRPVQSTLASGGTAYSVIQFSYDALGRSDCQAVRMTFVSLPSSACTQQAPHPNFGPDRISQTVYDIAGQVTELKTALGTADVATERTLTYTNNGRLQTLKDAENNLTTYIYDGFDRLSQTQFPVTTKGANQSDPDNYEQLTYDPGGNVTNRRLRDTQSIAYAYDNLNRLTVTAPPNPDPTVNNGYDNLGRLTSATKPAFGMSLTFSYDALNRNLTQVGPHGTVASEWDLAGRRTRLTWPDNFFVDYDYLVTGEMTKVRENGATSGAGVLATIAYDNLGRRASVTRGNGALTTYGYDPVSRLQTLTDKPSTATYDQTVTLAYTPASQITSRTGSNDAYAWTGHGSGSTASVADGLNRLSSIGGSAAGYDARGNLTSDPTSGKAFTYWPSDNALWTASSPWAALSYDPLGRLALIDSAGDTSFAYDGLAMIAEYDGAGTMLARYVHGPGVDEPLVRYDGSGTGNKQSLHADERGSITALSYGSPYAPTINRYDEYGKPQPGNIGRFQYTGQMWLGEAGVYYFKARAYSPTVGGRFLQTDPIGYEGGINLYAYVGNDPVNFTDPLGLDDGPPITVTGTVGDSSNLAALTFGMVIFMPDVDREGGQRACQPEQAESETCTIFVIRPKEKKPQKLPAKSPQTPRGPAIPGATTSAGGNRDWCGNKDFNAPEGTWPNACRSHDICYSTPGISKESCDAQLRRDVYHQCRTADPRTIPICAIISVIYQIGVALGGGESWERGLIRP